MRLVFIIYLLAFLLPAAIVFADETYSNGTYGNFSYGISSLASSSFSNNSINIPSNTLVVVNATGANSPNVTLEIVTNSTTSGAVTIVKYESKPSEVGTNTFTALNKYVDIVVNSSIKNELNYSVIKLFYTDAEVASSNLDESTLRLQKWNGSSWVQFDGPGIGGVEIADNYVWANTSSFSTWGVFGSSPAPAPSVSGGSGGSRGGGSRSIIVPARETSAAVEPSPASTVQPTELSTPAERKLEPSADGEAVALPQTESPGGLAAITGLTVQDVLDGKANKAVGAIGAALIIVLLGLGVYIRWKRSA